MALVRKTAGRGRGGLAKCPTGIQGLDEITRGGLPRGRPTLVCGAAGCGKSIMASEFLVRGATEYDEAGVLMTFEETAEDIEKNVASLGFDLVDLRNKKKLLIDHVRVDRSEIEENGEYDLDGLFIRLGYAIDSIKAKRVVLDTIEALFSGFSNQAILRAELRRLFAWLKEKGMTTVITAERGDGSLTRQGLEEYVSDCVILLDQKITNQVSTRRLRVVKYRGSSHGANEYPFLIDEDGVSVLPITSVGLLHEASSERISSGVSGLDEMLGGEGYYRGSSVLVTGTAGTGKSTLAAHFANATCARGEKCLYFAFEESPSQIMRNMSSLSLPLKRWVDRGLLKFVAARPTLYGLEMHLAIMHKHLREFGPSAVILDPVSNLLTAGSEYDAQVTLIRLIDHLKMRGITGFFVTLTGGGQAMEATQVGVSSLMDTWLMLRDIELGGERNRGLYVLKSRGMNHSNQIREFLLTPRGIKLINAYLGPEGVLTGSARLAQEAKEKASDVVREQEIARKQRVLEQKRHAMEAQTRALAAAFEVEKQELEAQISTERAREQVLGLDRDRMATSRRAAAGNISGNGRKSR